MDRVRGVLRSALSGALLLVGSTGCGGVVEDRVPATEGPSDPAGREAERSAGDESPRGASGGAAEGGTARPGGTASGAAGEGSADPPAAPPGCERDGDVELLAELDPVLDVALADALFALTVTVDERGYAFPLWRIGKNDCNREKLWEGRGLDANSARIAVTRSAVFVSSHISGVRRVALDGSSAERVDLTPAAGSSTEPWALATLGNALHVLLEMEGSKTSIVEVPCCGGPPALVRDLSPLGVRGHGWDLEYSAGSTMFSVLGTLTGASLVGADSDTDPTVLIEMSGAAPRPLAVFLGKAYFPKDGEIVSMRPDSSEPEPVATLEHTVVSALVAGPPGIAWASHDGVKHVDLDGDVTVVATHEDRHSVPWLQFGGSGLYWLEHGDGELGSDRLWRTTISEP